MRLGERMRYSDGPTTQVSIDIAAAPVHVWPLVADLELLAEASDELQSAAWLDPAAPYVGARFVGRNHLERRGSWDTTSHVVECEPPHHFARAVEDVERPAALWRFDIEATDEGTTLTQHVRLGPGPSGLTPMIEAEPEREHELIDLRLGMLRKGMQATVELVARRAESTAG